MAGAIAVFSLLVILFVSASARFERAYLNGPIVFLLAGGIVGRTLIDAQSEGAAIRIIAEVTLVLVFVSRRGGTSAAGSARRRGPRGLASIIFALIAFESLHEEPAIATVLSVIATTVVLSVLAHGLTASPWAQRYGAWASRTRPPVESAQAVEPLRRHGTSPPAARRKAPAR